MIGENPLIAVVLCGGKSSRMGFDKCLIEYHNQPQWQHTIEQFNLLGIDPIISCRPDQIEIFKGHETVVDQHVSIGPMGGLISVFNQYPGHAILLIGCDYPLLKTAHIKNWILQRDPSCQITTLTNSENKIEPTLCIYEPSAMAGIGNAFENKNYSLYRAITALNKAFVIESDVHVFSQANTVEEMQEIKSFLSK